MQKIKAALLLAAIMLFLVTEAYAVPIVRSVSEPDGTPAPESVDVTMQTSFSGSASDEWLAVQSWHRDTGKPLIKYFSKSVQNELNDRFGNNAEKLTCEGYSAKLTGYKSSYGKLALTLKSSTQLRDGQKLVALVGFPRSNGDAHYEVQTARTAQGGSNVVVTLDKWLLADYGQSVIILIIHVR
jgi:hypothetical protein